MDEKQRTEFNLLVEQCKSGQCRSINVASKVRSDAIIAAALEIETLRAALVAQDVNWAMLQVHHPHLVGVQRDEIREVLGAHP